MSGPTVSLLVGLAEHLSAHGIGVYQAAGAYSSTAVAIRLFDIPQTPDSVIVLTPYGIDDSVRTSVSVQGVQIRCRGPARSDPRPAQDLDDALFDLLHAAEHVQLGDVLVDSIERRSHLLLGVDGSGRWETSSNFAFTLTRPTLWRH